MILYFYLQNSASGDSQVETDPLQNPERGFFVGMLPVSLLFSSWIGGTVWLISHSIIWTAIAWVIPGLIMTSNACKWAHEEGYFCIPERKKFYFDHSPLGVLRALGVAMMSWTLAAANARARF